MKTFIFLLVLANLLFYAFSAGHFGRPDNPDAGRVDQQVAPERMRLVSRGEAPPAKVAEAPPPTPAEAPVTPPPAPAIVEKTCLRWERLSAEIARQLSTKLGDKFADFKLVKHLVAEEGSGWWVYIPPLPSKAEAEKKAGELRQLGIADYFIIPEEGPNRYAISLGVFSTEKGGQERLADLKAKGVKSARFNPRPGKDALITVEASGPLSEKAALRKMLAEAMPKVQAQDCK